MRNKNLYSFGIWGLKYKLFLFKKDSDNEVSVNEHQTTNYNSLKRDNIIKM